MGNTETALNVRTSRKTGLLFKLIARRLNMSFGETMEVLCVDYYEHHLRDHSKQINAIERELCEIDEAVSEVLLDK